MPATSGLISADHIHKGAEEKNETELQEFLGSELYDILQLAARAPSGHNTQPWMIEVIDETHLNLHVDPTRYLPAVDPTHRETLISLGCFLENLALAATHSGLRADIDITQRQTNETLIASIWLVRDKVITYPISRLERRRTIRNNHKSENINNQDLSFLTEGMDQESIEYIPGQSPQAEYLEKITCEANAKQIAHDEAQRELANWIWFSNRDIRANRDGLTPASMEMPWIARMIIGLFYDETNVMQPGFREKALENIYSQLNSYGGWLVLASRDSSVRSLIQTGRTFEQLALKACDRKIAVHPMSQALEESPWKDEIRNQLGVNGRVQLLLRLGYVDDFPEPVSPRRPVDWFVSEFGPHSSLTF